MEYVVVETGPRNVAQAEYKGYLVQVVTGFAIATDNYPVHVYAYRQGIDGRSGPRESLLRGFADTLNEGYDFGLQAARQEIDQR